MPSNVDDLQLYNLRVIALHYTISLAEYRRVFNIDFTNLSYCRNTLITLTHINAYRGSIQSTIRQLYNINYDSLIVVLQLLIDHGYIKTIIVTRRTNIPALRKLQGYSITPQGRQLLIQFDALINSKLLKLNK